MNARTTSPQAYSCSTTRMGYERGYVIDVSDSVGALSTSSLDRKATAGVGKLTRTRCLSIVIRVTVDPKKK